MNIVHFIVIFVFTSVRSELSVTVLQAEEMYGNVTEINQRSSASGLKSVHLYEGDYLQTEICLMPNTELSIQAIVYSNDGPADRIRVSLDTQVLSDFWTLAFTDGGKGWDRFTPYQPHQSIFSTIAEGLHILKLTVVQSDRYGVEIDNIAVTVNSTFPLTSLNCNNACFTDITFPYPKSVTPTVSTARAVQKSVNTRCAEEDNVNIPVFHDNDSTTDFVVTASLPKYRSFLNKRGPDWNNCRMSEAFWKYEGLSLNYDQLRETATSRLNITYVGSTVGTTGERQVSAIEVDFELEGPSSGSVNSEIGTLVHIENARYSGTLSVQFQYLDKFNSWSNMQRKNAKDNEGNIIFDVPDFSFREGKGNKIRIEVYSDQSFASNISFGKFYMHKRWLKPDTSTTLYKDGLTVIEGVDIDMWWRINETMGVTIIGENKTFHDVDYIRIYRRVPWTVDGFSQVFVLYQDANIRLLPTTPHGLDWIPFGSSVIIGQTNPHSNRPCAPISHLNIHPHLLHMTIFYMDGSVVPLKLQTTMSETMLHISGSHYVKDINLYPFFTFRSMYVADDNNDVDHISVDGGKPLKITEQWNEIRGNYFAFFRQCISQHNTQSPDISIQFMT